MEIKTPPTVHSHFQWFNIIVSQVYQFVKQQKPPGVTSTERIFIDFLLPDAPERYNQPEQLNYIIFQASRQGVYFLYLFLEVLYEKIR